MTNDVAPAPYLVSLAYAWVEEERGAFIAWSTDADADRAFDEAIIARAARIQAARGGVTP